MRSRPSPDASAAQVTRRRLDALTAELAAARAEVPAGATPPMHGSSAHTSPDPVPSPVRVPVPSPVPSTPGRHARRPLTARRRWAGWVEDRLPASWQGQAHLGSAQFGIVALVVSVGLVVSAWWLVRSGGSSDGPGDVVAPRPVVSSATLPSTPGSVSPEAGVTTGATAEPDGAEATGGALPAGQQGQIVVDVAGKVRRPGIAVLPAGSRVVDAVRAAGGMRPGVDRASVNLARPLTDGEQVLVGVPGGAGPAPGASPTIPATGGALVNLNTADQAALETLPGVGPVTAAAILQWRAEHGGFTSVDELLEVSGIGDATLADIAPHVTL